ncbi:type II secretion system protein [bacterium]|nr:type II secretion system protein [bacterium]
MLKYKIMEGRNLKEDIMIKNSSKIGFSLPEKLPFTLAEVFSSHFAGRHKTAFTLAEVLITLGIIGIVAALTMPALITKHQKHVVETRLKKFYSSINQAILRSEIVNGDRSDWFDDQANGYERVTPQRKKLWFDTYLKPYMNVLDEKTDDTTFFVYFSDGSVLTSSHISLRDWMFYTEEPEKCKKNANFYHKCAFYFTYAPKFSENINRIFAPYYYLWDGTEEGLYSGCNSSSSMYCGMLIQYNGWKIPKDYPW